MATGDQSVVNIPRESTMQEIAQALQTMAFTQAANMKNLSDWTKFSGLSRNGFIPKILNYGDQILSLIHISEPTRP